MRERGVSSASDVLVFSVLVSLALVVLTHASTVPADGGDLQFARETARGMVLMAETVPVGELGGLRYTVGFSGLSSDVVLGDRTLTQLVAECWVLKSTGALAGDMEERISELISGLLDNVIGQRFGYRWSADVLVPGADEPVFSVSAERGAGMGRFICSESSVLPVPPLLPRQGLPPWTCVRTTLEVWSYG